MKNLTREKALELHRQMWSDMQRDLGDNPNSDERWTYKERWINVHFPDEYVYNDCFLCEYCCETQYPDRDDFSYDSCVCPIKWPFGRCEEGWYDIRWDGMLISKLLALPEREEA